MPVERALLPEIDVSDKQNGDVQHHFYEPEPTRLHVSGQVLKYVCPGVKKNRLHVEQDEHHRHQVEFHGKRLARLPRWSDSAFIRLILGFTGTPPPNERRNQNQSTGEKGSNQQVYQ